MVRKNSHTAEIRKNPQKDSFALISDCVYIKRLLRFLVYGVLFAERTIFAEFYSVGIVLLILVIVVISLLAFGACQSDSGSVSFCHIFRLLKKLTPLMRSANLFYYTFFCLSTVLKRFIAVFYASRKIPFRFLTVSFPHLVFIAIIAFIRLLAKALAFLSHSYMPRDFKPTYRLILAFR